MGSVSKARSIVCEFLSGEIEEGRFVDIAAGMANTDGGQIYLGIASDGTVIGCNSDIGRRAVNLIRENTVPPLRTTCETIDVEGRQVVRLDVPRVTGIVAEKDGRFLKRIMAPDAKGVQRPCTVPMFPNEAASRFSDLRMFDFSSLPVPEADRADIDPAMVEKIRGMIRSNNPVSPLLSLDDDGLEKELGLLKFSGYEPERHFVPTVTGLLLSGTQDSLEKYFPNARISFQVIRGSDAVLNDVRICAVPEMLDRFDEFFKSQNTSESVNYGLFSVSVEAWPAKTVREGIINAIAHRDYLKNSGIIVSVTGNGMNIISPGGMTSGVDFTNLTAAVPGTRNLALTDALRKIGLMSCAGCGLRKMLEDSAGLGRMQPDYSGSNSENVVLHIPKANVDPAFTGMLADEQNRLGKPLSMDYLLIMCAVRNRKKIREEELASVTAIPEGRLKSDLGEMIEEGFIEPVGYGRERGYIPGERLYRRTGKSVEYVRQTGIERVRYREMILRLAREQGGIISKRDIIDLLHLNSNQAYECLRALEKSGDIRIINSGKYAKYALTEKAEEK